MLPRRTWDLNMLQALKQLVSRELRPRTGLELAQGSPGAGPHKDPEEAWAQELLSGLLLWAGSSR